MSNLESSLLTKEQVAALLQISLRTVEAWVKNGTLPRPLSMENRRYWLSNHLLALLESRYLEQQRMAVKTEVPVETPAEDTGRYAQSARLTPRNPQRKRSKHGVNKGAATSRLSHRTAADLDFLNA